MTPMRVQVSWKTGLALSLVSCLLLAGCITEPGTADDDATNTFVRINSVTSESGALGQAETGTDLLSDVCFADEDHPPCTYFNDNAIVTFTANPKDATQLSSQINDITFERYRVTYIRADGRNVPGIDVPYAFDGVSTFTVPLGTEVERSFIVVRHQAKIESPLREISLNTGAILSVLAQIDFYGRDIAGRAIKVTGYLNITFADFANE